MANLALLNVYQINGTVLPRDSPIKYGFPTQGCLVKDVSSSPTRSLSSGYNVYGLIIVPQNGAADVNGTLYYVAETISQISTIFG